MSKGSPVALGGINSEINKPRLDYWPCRMPSAWCVQELRGPARASAAASSEASAASSSAAEAKGEK